MRKEYAAPLRKAFNAHLNAKLPQFTELKIKSKYLWPGERVFAWDALENLRCMIILSPHPKGLDGFCVELAWSKLMRFPELSMRPTGLPKADHAEFAREEYAIRLGELLPTAGPQADKVGWIHQINIAERDPEKRMAALKLQVQPITSAEVEQKVLPVIMEALNEIVLYGVPYFEKLIAYCRHAH